MMTEDEIIALFAGLTRNELHRWIEYGWVQPAQQGDRYVFAEIDCARVRLIHDVHDTMDVNDEVMPLVLSLLDQVYGLRHELRRLTRAVQAQPEDVRRAVAERCAALDREE